jgi:predicted ATPase
MVNEFKNGVFFVELAPISDSDLIIPAVAEAVGYQFQQDGRSPIQQTIDYLSNKQTLLIVDNYEHLLEGAGIVTELLHSAALLKVLVTSRQRLFQPGETVFPLPGLMLPEMDRADDAAHTASVELFLQTARRVRPDFALPLLFGLSRKARG